MVDQQRLAKTVIFPTFLLACFIVGRMIPTFYDWSGANQSYSTHAADQAFWGLVSFGVLAWFVIPWLPMNEALAIRAPAEDEPKRFQFNLYSLLLLTTVVAIACAAIAKQSVAICMLMWVVTFVAAVRMIVKALSWKWQFSALLACMYFPYAWVIDSGEFRNLNWELVFGAIGLPSFVPTLFLGRFVFDARAEDMIWLWPLMVVVEAAIGFYLIRKSPRCSIAYFVLVMLISIFGSMFLNVGTRI